MTFYDKTGLLAHNNNRKGKLLQKITCPKPCRYMSSRLCDVNSDLIYVRTNENAWLVNLATGNKEKSNHESEMYLIDFMEIDRNIGMYCSFTAASKTHFVM